LHFTHFILPGVSADLIEQWEKYVDALDLFVRKDCKLTIHRKEVATKAKDVFEYNSSICSQILSMVYPEGYSKETIIDMMMKPTNSSPSAIESMLLQMVATFKLSLSEGIYTYNF
jgi:hypothetical protein